MKLCHLLHESGHKCPKCGGTVNALGKSIPEPQDLVFPDEHGRWKVGNKYYTADEIDQLESNGQDPGDPNVTRPFKQVYGTPTGETQHIAPPKDPKKLARRNKPQKSGKPGMLQALLRYRKELADEN